MTVGLEKYFISGVLVCGFTVHVLYIGNYQNISFANENTIYLLGSRIILRSSQKQTILQMKNTSLMWGRGDHGCNLNNVQLRVNFSSILFVQCFLDNN